MILSSFFEMELMQIAIFIIKLLLLFIVITIIATMPFIPKIVKTQINKWNARHGQVPSVNYLPEIVKKIDKSEEDEKVIDDNSSIENDLENTRKEKREVYKDYSMEKLRKIAVELGQDGNKIKKYYRLDKETLVEAIIQTEEIVAIQKAYEESQEEISMPDDTVN